MGNNNKRKSYNRRKRHEELVEERRMQVLYEEAKKFDPDYLNTVEGQMYGNLDAMDIYVDNKVKEEVVKQSFFSKFYPSRLFSWIL